MKQEVLRICGERDDGNSPFDDAVIRYLDDVHKGLLSGGNLFGMDVGEAWTWAEAANPLVLTLEPMATGTISAASQWDSSITFTASPEDPNGDAVDPVGWYLSIDGYSDMYKVLVNTSGFDYDIDGLITADLDATDATVTLYKLDYNLKDSALANLLVTNKNNVVYYELDSSYGSVTLTNGSYTQSSLLNAVASLIATATSATVSIYTDSKGQKQIGAPSSTTFSLLFASGDANLGSLPHYTNDSNIHELLGFEKQDYTGQLYYKVPYSNPAVLRITRPILTYRETPVFGQAAKDAGKIFMLDANTFTREFPLARLGRGVPTRFCVTEQNKQGIQAIRFNSVVEELVKIEMHYIPVPYTLVDSTDNYALVPTPFTKFLVYGASYYLLMDKSDSKAQQYFSMAQAELKAMISDNRKSLSLSGQNYGRLIPRANIGRYYGFKA